MSAGYFAVLKTPLKQGRVFTDHDADSTERVVVVNEAFVRRFSPQRDVVGRRLRYVWRGATMAWKGSRNHRRRRGCAQ